MFLLASFCARSSHTAPAAHILVVTLRSACAGHPPTIPQEGHELMENESDLVGGYAVPTDPMDELQCDSCQ